MDNNLTVIGNLTRDPELRFSAAGTAILNFSVAVNRKRGDEEETSFFDVSCFGSLAENASECLTKGMRAVVTGRLEQQSWEKDGERKTKVAIVADDIGPSLRWATTEVTRNERKDEERQPARTGGGRNGSQSRRSAPRHVDYDEELF